MAAIGVHCQTYLIEDICIPNLVLLPVEVLAAVIFGHHVYHSPLVSGEHLTSYNTTDMIIPNQDLYCVEVVAAVTPRHHV